MPQVVVPIAAGTNQSFTCSLPVGAGNITLTFQLTWNAQGAYWWLSVTDSSGNLLLDGVPVITGQYPAANILQQYTYLQIGSAYVVPSSANLPDNPDFTTLGTQTTTSASTFYLIWSDNIGYVA